MGIVYLSVVSLIALFLTFLSPRDAAAQGFTIGAGPGTGSVPRALAPLCGSARHLKGWGVSGRAGFSAGPVRIGGPLDFLGRWGTTEVASCVPRFGLSVDSVFARAKNGATSAALWSWIPVGSLLRVGAEAGTVINHDSWFVGPTLGAQADRVRVWLLPY